MKGVRTRSHSGPHFPTLRLNTDAEKYGPEELSIRTRFMLCHRQRRLNSRKFLY